MSAAPVRSRAKVEREEYVILEIVDGVATDVVHFPAPETRNAGSFAAHIVDGMTPDSWPAMCGPLEYCPAHDAGWYSRNRPHDPLIRECKGCGGRFAQERRQGRPRSYCDSCRPGDEFRVSEAERLEEAA